MSDTPITDANVCITTKEGCETIAPDICRKFERENAAMREAIRVAHEAIVLSPYPDADALTKLQPYLKP